MLLVSSLLFVELDAEQHAIAEINSLESDEAQQAAIAEIKKLGGLCGFDEHSPGKPVLRVVFNSTQITDAGLVHLKGLTSLRSLSLRYTQITDAGLQHLKELTNLSDMYLQNTQITDAGLEYLKGLTRLKRLYLEGTQITDDGVKKLQEALPKLKIIEQQWSR